MAEYGYSFLRGYQATAPRALVASSDDEPQDDLLAVLLVAVCLKGPLSRVLSTLFYREFFGSRRTDAVPRLPRGAERVIGLARMRGKLKNLAYSPSRASMSDSKTRSP